MPSLDFKFKKEFLEVIKSKLRPEGWVGVTQKKGRVVECSRSVVPKRVSTPRISSNWELVRSASSQTYRIRSSRCQAHQYCFNKFSIWFWCMVKWESLLRNKMDKVLEKIWLLSPANHSPIIGMMMPVPQLRWQLRPITREKQGRTTIG